MGHTDVTDPGFVDVQEPMLPERPPVSLAERMAAKRDRKERQQTEIFPVPGWGEMLAVELRALGTKKQDRLGSQHEAHPDPNERVQLTMADHIVNATVKFYEVNAEGDRRELEPTFSWLTAAKGPYPDMDPSTTSRSALRLLIEDHLKWLWAAWQQWMQNRGAETDQELQRDF